MEISTITAALAGIKNATDIAKIIKNSASSLEAAEMKFKLAELIDSLADAKMEIANTKHLIIDKETEIQKLKKELEISKNVFWKEPFYFVELLEGQDGPYCQKCYDSKKLLIRVQSPNKNGFWICNECNSNYRDETYKSETISTVPLIRSVRMRDY